MVKTLIFAFVLNGLIEKNMFIQILY